MRQFLRDRKGECHVVGLGLLAYAPLLLRSVVEDRHLRDLFYHDDVDDA
jgi:hypothetical protein